MHRATETRIHNLTCNEAAMPKHNKSMNTRLVSSELCQNIPADVEAHVQRNHAADKADIAPYVASARSSPTP
jgi:hypothetical protein